MKMLALFFEVMPKPGHEDDYFRHVGMLKPVLEKHTGMVWLDRFKSLSRDNLILSHQLWEDEAAIVRWREDERHKGSQTAGRYKHFQDYRIRIAELFARVEQGRPVEKFVPGPDADGGFVVAGHSEGKPLQGFSESFASVNVDGAFVGLNEAADEADARERLAGMAADPAMTWGFAARMVRDYGMYQRDQAPQDYPPVEPSGAA
jgi:heme-degrading monooxygenase HmoA